MLSGADLKKNPSITKDRLVHNMDHQHNGPLSPTPSAPSRDDYDDLLRLARHNAATPGAVADSQMNAELVALPAMNPLPMPGPHTEYGTPTSTGPDGYPQDANLPIHFLGHQQQDAHFSIWMDQPPQHHQPLHADQGYNTPIPSPPRSSRQPDIRTTRSSARLIDPAEKNRRVQSGRIQKGAEKKNGKKSGKKGEKKSEKKSEKKKANGKDPNSQEDLLTKGLSLYARDDHPEVKVADIGKFVLRSTETRKLELAKSKTPEDVKRPMNAFMLYRKTYQEVAKHVHQNTNHQHVSVVCGEGWRKEEQDIKQRFGNWADIEKQNHHAAFPDYKFAPAKTKKSKRVVESECESILDDLEFDGGESSQARHTARPRPAQEPAVLVPPSVFNEGDRHRHAFETHSAELGASQNQSSYHYSNPGKPMPMPMPFPTYGAHRDPDSHDGYDGLPRYYQRQTASVYPLPGRGGGYYEDVMVRKTPSPTIGHAHGLPDDGLGAFTPYPAHAPHPTEVHVGTQPPGLDSIDPALVSTHGEGHPVMATPGDGSYDGLYHGVGVEHVEHQQQRWHPQPGLTMAGPHDSSHDSLADAIDPIFTADNDSHQPFLRGDGHWQIEDIGEGQSQFDGWPQSE